MRRISPLTSADTQVLVDFDGVQLDVAPLAGTVTYNTGWRSTTPPTESGYLFDGTGTIQIRRRGGADPSCDVIDFRFLNVGLASGVTGGSYLAPAYFIPAGFRVLAEEREWSTIGNVSGSGEYRVGIYQQHRVRLAPTSSVPGTGTLALQGTFTRLADGARPTTLPWAAV